MACTQKQAQLILFLNQDSELAKHQSDFERGFILEAQMTGALTAYGTYTLWDFSTLTSSVQAMLCDMDLTKFDECRLYGNTYWITGNNAQLQILHHFISMLHPPCHGPVNSCRHITHSFCYHNLNFLLCWKHMVRNVIFPYIVFFHKCWCPGDQHIILSSFLAFPLTG